MAQFTVQDKEKLVQEIQALMDDAQIKAKFNQGWDITFKVTLLILTIGTTICAAFITTYQEKPPVMLSVTNAILAGLSTALSVFAFTQFNFASRNRIWQKKADALSGLKTELLYSDPEIAGFLKRYQEVREWNDHTDPSTILGVSPP